MTRLFRTGLLIACVTLLSSWGWAQAPQFEGFAPGMGVPYNFGHQGYQPAAVEPELLPADRGPFYDYDSLVDLELMEMARGLTFETEYLYADFQRPGNNLLGAPIASVPNPREPFFVSAGVLVDARAVVPDTSRLELGAQNGVRTTLGIHAFNGFSVVGSYVGMQHMGSSFQRFPGNVDPAVAPLVPDVFDPLLFPDNVRFYGTSVLTNGTVGNSVILYDRKYEADLEAQYWSGDINVVLDSRTPDTGFQFRPLFGFKFTSYDEDLVQHGEFDNSSGIDATLGTLATPLRNTIRSATQNTMCLGQIGFQAEMVDKWFTIGVAPKVAMGSNSIRTNVFTSDLRDSDLSLTTDDGITSVSKSNVIFGSTIDLNAYLKVHVNEWLSLTGSVYYWYMPTVARASNVIVYDDQGIDVPSAFHPRIKTNSLSVQGFTLGAEIRF